MDVILSNHTALAVVVSVITVACLIGVGLYLEHEELRENNSKINKLS